MAGGAAGIVNGFFGGGGGMVLVPLLMSRCALDRRHAFASSVAIIFPLCALSAIIYYTRGHLDLMGALPYLVGAARMMGWLIALLAGTITGILSAFGIGGGSLLLIYLTSFAAIDQHQAQGINLLYFLPAAAAALPAHHKHGLLDKKVILPAILAGLAAAGLAAWLSSSLDTGLLRKLFGLFLLYVGLRELFHKDPDQSEKDDTK